VSTATKVHSKVHVSGSPAGHRIVDRKSVGDTRANSGLFGLWHNRNLIGLLIHQDFIGRYKGSLLGAVWPLLNPLGHMVLYTFLFSIILGVRFGSAAGTVGFALNLMAGFLPWTAMAEALSSSATKILEVPNLVKRVVFPLEVLPLVLSISAFMTCCISLLLLIGFNAILMQKIYWTVLLLPMVLLPHFLFTAGLAWFIASIGVFVRDTRHMISLGLSAWMYASPVVYPASMLPANLKFILWINPVAGIITDYRRLILEGNLPEVTSYAVYASISVIACMVGYAFFMKTKQAFADVM